MRQSRGLIDEPPLLVQPSLARALGLADAVVVQQIHYWLMENARHERNFINGRYWTYNSVESWRKQFSFLTEWGIRYVFDRLKKGGVLETQKLSEDKRDRTLYYTLNYDRIDDLLEQEAEANEESPEKIARCIRNKVPYVYKETETTTEKQQQEVSEMDGADESGQTQAGEDEHELLRPERPADDLTAFATMPIDEYVRGLESDGVEHLARNPYRRGLPVSAISTQECSLSWRREDRASLQYGTNIQLRAKAWCAVVPVVQRLGPKHSLRVGGGYMTGIKSLVARMRGGRM